MNRNVLLALTIVGLLALQGLPSASGAAVNSSLRTYLSAYMQNTIINDSVYVPQTIGTGSYTIMQLPTGVNQYLVINTTGGYSMMQNASQIAVVLAPYLRSAYYPSSSTISYLTSAMNRYKASTAANITDCLYQTGLATSTCTLANQCTSCQFVPNCKKTMNKYGGPSGIYARGIMDFAANYLVLNGSYNSYFAITSTLNSSNIGAGLDSISSIISNISAVAGAMPQNPLFPLPANFSSGLFSSCNGQADPLTQPWYCVDVGGCQYLTFNGVALDNLSSTVYTLRQLPITPANINATASASAALAVSYVSPVSAKALQAKFNAFIGAISPKYNASIAAAEKVSLNFSNSSLAAATSQLKGAYAAVQLNGPGQNLTAANVTLTGLIAKLNGLTHNITVVYRPLYSAAANNTNLAVVAELNYRTPPPGLALIAATQQKINLQIRNGVNATAAALLQKAMKPLSGAISGYSAPFSMALAEKGLYGGLATAIESGMASPIAAKMASVPAYAALLSFVIGMVILAAVYMGTYHRLSAGNRIRRHPRVRSAWMALFGLLFLLVLVFTYASYAYAAGGNSFLPVSGFLSLLKADRTAYVAVNTTQGANPAVAQCAAALSAVLSGKGKVVKSITLQNFTCASGNVTSYDQRCFDRILASGHPVIYLSPGANFSIVYRGMYGSVLYASGPAASGPSCLASALVRDSLGGK